MKTAVCKPTYRPVIPYPNAATRRQMLLRFLDHILVVACGMGLAATLLLLAVIL